jgi:hypothetical protein
LRKSLAVGGLAYPWGASHDDVWLSSHDVSVF